MTHRRTVINRARERDLVLASHDDCLEGVHDHLLACLHACMLAVDRKRL